jgi:hypothetical protein
MRTVNPLRTALSLEIPRTPETLEAEVPRAYEALMKHHKAALQKTEQTGHETGYEALAKELAESKAESTKIQNSYKSSLKKFEACDKVRMACVSHVATFLEETKSLKRKNEDEEKGKKEAQARMKRAFEATKLKDPATQGGSSM